MYKHKEYNTGICNMDRNVSNSDLPENILPKRRNKVTIITYNTYKFLTRIKTTKIIKHKIQEKKKKKKKP